MQKILFATSEVHPLIKTGGLADVAASLPRALLKLGHDVKIILPAYASVMQKLTTGVKEVAQLHVDGRILSIKQTRLPGSRVTVLLVDIPEFSARDGNPYCGPDGADWFDNHKRFYLFAKAAELIALDQAQLEWRPTIVHCNDWQTGLIPALLSLHPERPATVFTIHNLAYRGLFPYQAFEELQLPSGFWHHERIEFYGQMSFMKGGLAFADFITTVSPSYANEIQQPEFGCGLDGLMRYRSDSLAGILNGIDMDEWNPGSDAHISVNFNRRTLGNKVKNKLALQEELGLTLDERLPLLGFVGRLVDQKGIDLILAQMPQLLSTPCQLVILGSGFPHYEAALTEIANTHPGRVSVTIGYNESFAHRIEASSDIFLMPSLFEPCGLNQLYSLRYGTLPVVHAVGGLRDTVFEQQGEVVDEHANGFVFEHPTPELLFAAIERALATYEHPARWKQLQLNAMSKDFSWDLSAQQYVAIYDKLA
ncbi:glycogen synthase GlgA [Cellvibrio sp. PSBB023]|uniref:glycogen synthase GlgA n=1 Tax=Cellvibrio sp. PSBB023 TaxID=1945512 RepID=UPI00098EB5E4|nr:glycogen synthase GlgA [Cellvibrio sp. PSBB023]AQT59515.1 starch synthase [Cellvibrio sp. PSBB023]